MSKRGGETATDSEQKGQPQPASKRALTRSFNFAIEGLVHVIRTQRSMQIHFGVALLVLLASLFLDFSRIELIVLLLTIAMVIIAEMFNTVIEAVVDIYISEKHPKAKIAKDVSAGAVLFASLVAVVIGYLLFFDRLSSGTTRLIFRVASSNPAITVICLALIVTIVIFLKAFKKKGSFLSGGFPSGHSALAFGIFTSITLITKNYIVATLAFLLALLVVQSRLEKRIHDIYEVLVGSALGVLVTLLVFQVITRIRI